jgi:hypothetical protein
MDDNEERKSEKERMSNRYKENKGYAPMRSNVEGFYYFFVFF